jgi:hypothetical protein
MTPYQFNLITENYLEKQKEEMEKQLMQIYLSAVWTSRWVWEKKVPSFESIMKKAEPKKPKTDEEMLEEVKKLNAMFGGTVRYEKSTN